MSFPNGYQGQANTTVSDAIATAMNPGVSPADYTTANHYKYHKMMGQNVRCTPLLLGMESPLVDTVYPSKAQLTALGIQAFAESEATLEESKSAAKQMFDKSPSSKGGSERKAQ